MVADIDFFKIYKLRTTPVTSKFLRLCGVPAERGNDCQCSIDIETPKILDHK